MPAHHTLEEHLASYIREARIGEDKKGPLFRSALVKNGKLSDRPLDRVRAFRMIQQRARVVGIETQIGNHTFRATGIAIYPHVRFTLGNLSHLTTRPEHIRRLRRTILNRISVRASKSP